MYAPAGLSRRTLLNSSGAAVLLGALGLSPARAVDPVSEYPFTPNKDLVNAFTARRGGIIGTEGKPAVSFRCDHHLNKFASLLLPLHRKYDIPVTLAFGSQVLTREVGTNGSHLLTFPGIQKMSLENGFEIGNHGATHQDAVTGPELRAEIVYSKWALEKAMPKLPIELYVPAGVGKTSFGGFYGARKQSDYQQFLAGRVIVANHAVATGYVPGYWPMSGDPMNAMGAVHINIENATYAARGPSFVRAAAAQGRGVNFMYHPSLIDTTDLAAIEDFFVWCAEERSAGRLEILSSTGLMMASFGSSVRHNLVSSKPSFRDGWNGWNGAVAGWAMRTEEGIKYARRGSRSTTLAKDLGIGPYVGATRQLRIPMRSTTGVKARVEVFDSASRSRLLVTKDLVLPRGERFSNVHQYLTLPLTGTPRISISITLRSGGELHVREPQLLAA